MLSAEEPGRGAPVVAFSHVQLRVSDVGTSARWYKVVLGLVPFAEDLDIGYVALRHPEAKFVVVLTQGPAPREGTPELRREALDHLAFAVADGEALATWASHLTDVGIEHPGVVSEEGRPSLQLRDPDGVAVELVAPP